MDNMDTQQIIDKLEGFLVWVKEDLDTEAKDYGYLKAIKDHDSKLCDIKLAELKIKYEGSDASQTTNAKANPEWAEFLTTHRGNLADFYTLDYKKGMKMEAIGALRSLLSFEKGRFNQEV